MATRSSAPAAESAVSGAAALLPPELAGRSKDELLELLSCHAGEAEAQASSTQATEDLVKFLRQPLGRCPICLEEVAAVDDFTRCQHCLAPFHRSCASQHAISAAQHGQVPLSCPVPGCRRPWTEEILRWALDEQQKLKYDNAVHALTCLRSSGGRDDSVSPRFLEELKKVGVRPCPRCQSLIQKQAEGLLTGCDKMTCRCGCMFCFKCGTEARAGGVARCRCVGVHHQFIPQSQVLSNYRGAFSLGAAGDQDLTKRPRGKASAAASARLRKELKVFSADPPPYINVRNEESNILMWHFLLQGPPDTPYEGGWYWGRLDIPKDYPFSPPLVKVVTPTARFEADSWLCRTVFDYHPEGWQPPWTIAGVLTALLSLMCDDSFTSGAIHPSTSDAVKRDFAHKSLQWNMEQADFIRIFGPVAEKLMQKSAAARDGHPNPTTS